MKKENKEQERKERVQHIEVIIYIQLFIKIIIIKSRKILVMHNNYAAQPTNPNTIFRCVCAVLTYCVSGGIYRYKRNDARGLAVIPHYSFWMDLPCLIKV